MPSFAETASWARGSPVDEEAKRLPPPPKVRQTGNTTIYVFIIVIVLLIIIIVILGYKLYINRGISLGDQSKNITPSSGEEPLSSPLP